MVSDIRQYHSKSPAKINLFLHVTGQRPDGYHLLESIFCPISLADDITLSIQKAGTDSPFIQREGDLDHIPLDSDLTVRALQAYSSKVNLTQFSFTIKTSKRIPEQAGLGGGSSNAATILRLLQNAFNHPLTEERLLALATGLGADVPFFLQPNSAFVTGIGEKIAPLHVPKASLLLYKPPENCPTSKIFQAKQLTRNTSPVKMSVFDSTASAADRENWWEWLSTNTGNSLQQVVEQIQPTWLQRFTEFRDIALSCNALLVRMTGSGSAMFAVFDCEASAVLCQAASSGLEGDLFVSQIESRDIF